MPVDPEPVAPDVEPEVVPDVVPDVLPVEPFAPVDDEVAPPAPPEPEESSQPVEIAATDTSSAAPRPKSHFRFMRSSKRAFITVNAHPLYGTT